MGRGTQQARDRRKITHGRDPAANLALCAGIRSRSVTGSYFSSTVAPASSSSAFNFSASSRSTPSLIAPGRLVDDRLRLFQAEAGRGADDLDDRHFLAADLGQHDVDRRGLFVLRRRPPRRRRRAAGAAAATAVAETPNSSSSALIRSESSRTEMPFSSSIQSSFETFVAIYSSFSF